MAHNILKRVQLRMPKVPKSLLKKMRVMALRARRKLRYKPKNHDLNQQIV